MAGCWDKQAHLIRTLLVLLLAGSESAEAAPLCGSTCTTACHAQGYANSSAGFSLCCELCSWSVGCQCDAIDEFINGAVVSKEPLCTEAGLLLLREGCTCAVCGARESPNCGIINDTPGFCGAFFFLSLCWGISFRYFGLKGKSANFLRNFAVCLGLVLIAAGVAALLMIVLNMHGTAYMPGCSVPFSYWLWPSFLIFLGPVWLAIGFRLFGWGTFDTRPPAAQSGGELVRHDGPPPFVNGRM